MADPSASAIPRGPGRIVVSPTNVSSANAGGTVLGATRAHEVDFLDDETLIVPGEEFGGAPVDALEGMQCIAFMALMRGFDPAGLAALFPNTSTGASTGAKNIDGTVQGTVRAGHLRSGRSAKILFIPDDAANRAIYIPKPLMFIPRGDRSRFSILSETTIGVVWLSMPDTANSGRTYQMRRLADIVL